MVAVLQNPISKNDAVSRAGTAVGTPGGHSGSASPFGLSSNQTCSLPELPPNWALMGEDMINGSMINFSPVGLPIQSTATGDGKLVSGGPDASEDEGAGFESNAGSTGQ